MALTINQITQASLDILEDELGKAYVNKPPYCLLQITLHDGTTHELMMRMQPHNLYDMGADMKKSGMLVVDNEESAILVLEADVKQITVTKVTKEQP